MKITELDSGLNIKSGIKEKMDIKIENINENLAHRNGYVYALVGSAGSGKSSMLLSMFKSTKFYKKKFDNIYLFTPRSSYLSVEKHPFEDHENVYHELTIKKLETIYNELNELKENSINDNLPIENSIIIIDDFGNDLKNNDLIIFLNKMIIKARHLSCCFIFTLQNYFLLPLTIRKQITNCTIFKSKNKNSEFINNQQGLIIGEYKSMTDDLKKELKQTKSTSFWYKLGTFLGVISTSYLLIVR